MLTLFPSTSGITQPESNRSLVPQGTKGQKKGQFSTSRGSFGEGKERGEKQKTSHRNDSSLSNHLLFLKTVIAAIIRNFFSLEPPLPTSIHSSVAARLEARANLSGVNSTQN